MDMSVLIPRSMCQRDFVSLISTWWIVVTVLTFFNGDDVISNL